MRCVKFLAVTAMTATLVTLAAFGQTGGWPKGDKGKKGKAQNTRSELLPENLTLTDAQREKARDALHTDDEKMRDVTRQLRSELLGQMKDILSEEEFKAFKDELAQVPLLPTIPPNGTVAADDLVTRLMAYDKNGDGKITKDEFPERMHRLIEEGDRNGDGALDRDEIRRLAERSPPGPGGRPPGGPRPPGPRPPPPKE